MQKINTLDLLNCKAWQSAVLSIRGEAAHRLHNILLLKLNASGRYDNRINCDPKELSTLMGYKSTYQLKTARKALVSLGLWEYHESEKYDHNGRKQGFFSVPQRFLQPSNLQGMDMIPSKELQGMDMIPSKEATESKSEGLQGMDMIPSKELQGMDMIPSKEATESKSEGLQGMDMIPRVGMDLIPYIYREIDRYIDDDDMRKVIKKYLKEGKPFLYKGDVLEGQLTTITTLCKKVDKKTALEVAKRVLDTHVQKDVLNYLIQSLRSIATPKPQKKKATTYYKPRKKRVEVGTDWSKKKAKVVDMDPKEVKQFFLDFEKAHGMTQKSHKDIEDKPKEEIKIQDDDPEWLKDLYKGH